MCSSQLLCRVKASQQQQWKISQNSACYQQRSTRHPKSKIQLSFLLHQSLRRHFETGSAAFGNNTLKDPVVSSEFQELHILFVIHWSLSNPSPVERREIKNQNHGNFTIPISYTNRWPVFYGMYGGSGDQEEGLSYHGCMGTLTWHNLNASFDVVAG